MHVLSSEKKKKKKKRKFHERTNIHGVGNDTPVSLRNARKSIFLCCVSVVNERYVKYIHACIYIYIYTCVTYAYFPKRAASKRFGQFIEGDKIKRARPSGFIRRVAPSFFFFSTLRPPLTNEAEVIDARPVNRLIYMQTSRACPWNRRA